MDRMRANGSAQEDLTLNPAQDKQASWSGDGQHILFVTNRDSNKEVYTINANGGAPRPLSYHKSADNDPVFGSHVATGAVEPFPDAGTGITRARLALMFMAFPVEPARAG